MRISMLLAPRIETKHIVLAVLAYLFMVLIVTIMTANPFQSTGSLDFGVGVQGVSASSYATEETVPMISGPSAPYLITESAP